MSNIFKFEALYKKSSSGKTLLWWMELCLDTFSYRVHSGQKGGAIKATGWTAAKPKNVGKSNETTALEQAKLEIQQKYNKQLKGQYFESESDIDKIQFFPPMLAKKFTDRAHKVRYPVHVQRKLDGIRCVVHEDHPDWLTGKGGFSRKGEQFHCIEHILEEAHDITARFPLAVLDGELFKHGVVLNDIASLVSVARKAKDVTPEDLEKARQLVNYNIYDGFGFGVDRRAPFGERHEALQDILKGYNYLHPVETFLAQSEDEVMELTNRFIKEGYEGGIVRLPESYDMKRSDSLLKVKKFDDDEFEIVDIEASDKGDWNGCAKRIVCKLSDGKTFESNIRGSMEDLRKLFVERHKHIGKLATVEYQGFGNNGRPLIPYTQLPFSRNYE